MRLPPARPPADLSALISHVGQWLLRCQSHLCLLLYPPSLMHRHPKRCSTQDQVSVSRPHVPLVFVRSRWCCKGPGGIVVVPAAWVSTTCPGGVGAVADGSGPQVPVVFMRYRSGCLGVHIRSRWCWCVTGCESTSGPGGVGALPAVSLPQVPVVLVRYSVSGGPPQVPVVLVWYPVSGGPPQVPVVLVWYPVSGSRPQVPVVLVRYPVSGSRPQVPVVLVRYRLCPLLARAAPQALEKNISTFTKSST